MLFTYDDLDKISSNFVFITFNLEKIFPILLSTVLSSWLLFSVIVFILFKHEQTLLSFDSFESTTDFIEVIPDSTKKDNLFVVFD